MVDDVEIAFVFDRDRTPPGLDQLATALDQHDDYDAGTGELDTIYVSETATAKLSAVRWRCTTPTGTHSPHSRR